MPSPNDQAQGDHSAARIMAEQNLTGHWVPAIPVPFYLPFGRKRCKCGATRWRMRRYREHYAYVHIHQGVPV